MDPAAMIRSLPVKLLRFFIRLRRNTLQLVGVKRKSRLSGLRGASFFGICYLEFQFVEFKEYFM